jgi:hypothetical protein
MSKWFFEPANAAGERMREMFDDYVCLYQMISEDRVVEQFVCRKNGETKDVLLLLVRHGSDTNVSIIMYELTPIASKHFQK